MNFPQFLAGKGRAKIRVFCSDKRDNKRAKLRGEGVIRAFPTSAGNQPLRIFRTVALYQPFYLPDGDSYPFGSLGLGDMVAERLADNLESIEFLVTHTNYLF